MKSGRAAHMLLALSVIFAAAQLLAAEQASEALF